MHACRHSYPSSGGHDAVVDHVEGGQVAELLVEEEEDGVQHVQELGEVVPPGRVQGRQGRVAASTELLGAQLLWLITNQTSEISPAMSPVICSLQSAKCGYAIRMIVIVAMTVIRLMHTEHIHSCT